MNSYGDLDYNKFLNKPSGITPELTSQEFDTFVDTFSASKINQGKSASQGLEIDYDQGRIVFKQNGLVKIEMGKFTDGVTGLRVYDNLGTVMAEEVDTP